MLRGGPKQAPAGRGALDRLPRFDRPGEVHLLHAARLQDRGRLVVAEDEVLEDAGGQPRLVERALEALADQERLGRVLEHDRRVDAAGRRRRGPLPPPAARLRLF